MLDKWDKAKMMIISYIILKDSIVQRINTLVALLEKCYYAYVSDTFICSIKQSTTGTKIGNSSWNNYVILCSAAYIIRLFLVVNFYNNGNGDPRLMG